jgi:hypothetical protein
MNYPSKELMKNLTPVPRTISEANRDARYACAIQGFKSDAKLTLGFIVDCLIGFVVTIAVVSPFVVGFYVWLNK